MATIVPINDFTFAEILFENSEEVPNDIYINLMNLLKIYHEEQSNTDDINDYLIIIKPQINKKLYKKLSKFITKQSCYYFPLKIPCFIFLTLFFMIALMTTVIYFIASRRNCCDVYSNSKNVTKP